MAQLVNTMSLIPHHLPSQHYCFQSYLRPSLQKQSFTHSRLVQTCQAVFHIFRSCARLGLLCMDVSRFTCLLYLLLSFSALLIFYLGGRMSGWEEIISWSRQPAFEPDTRIITNSNKTGDKIL